jgi:hypothetical protein
VSTRLCCPTRVCVSAQDVGEPCGEVLSCGTDEDGRARINVRVHGMLMWLDALSKDGEPNFEEHQSFF